MITAIAPPQVNTKNSKCGCFFGDNGTDNTAHPHDLGDETYHGTHSNANGKSGTYQIKPPAGALLTTKYSVVPSAPVPRIGTPHFSTKEEKKNGVVGDHVRARPFKFPDRPAHFHFHFFVGVGFQTFGEVDRHAVRPDAHDMIAQNLFTE